MSSGVSFAWQDKRALRLIRERLEDPATAIALYVAITEAVSDAASPTVTMSHARISTLSGVGARTVDRRIGELESIGLITITRPALKAPAVFALLPAAPDAPSDPKTGSRLIRHDGGAKRHDGGTLRHEYRHGGGTLSKEEKKGEYKPTTQSTPLTQSQQISAEQELKRVEKSLVVLNTEPRSEWDKPEFQQRLSAATRRRAELKLIVGGGS